MPTPRAACPPASTRTAAADVVASTRQHGGVWHVPQELGLVRLDFVAPVERWLALVGALVPVPVDGAPVSARARDAGGWWRPGVP